MIGQTCNFWVPLLGHLTTEGIRPLLFGSSKALFKAPFPPFDQGFHPYFCEHILTLHEFCSLIARIRDVHGGNRLKSTKDWSKFATVKDTNYFFVRRWYFCLCEFSFLLPIGNYITSTIVVFSACVTQLWLIASLLSMREWRVDHDLSCLRRWAPKHTLCWWMWLVDALVPCVLGWLLTAYVSNCTQALVEPRGSELRFGLSKTTIREYVLWFWVWYTASIPCIFGVSAYCIRKCRLRSSVYRACGCGLTLRFLVFWDTNGPRTWVVVNVVLFQPKLTSSSVSRKVWGQGGDLTSWIEVELVHVLHSTMVHWDKLWAWIHLAMSRWLPIWPMMRPCMLRFGSHYRTQSHNGTLNQCSMTLLVSVWEGKKVQHKRKDFGLGWEHANKGDSFKLRKCIYIVIR